MQLSTKPSSIEIYAIAAQLSILTGDGTGGFAVLASYRMPVYPATLNATDLNGDHKLDVGSAITGGVVRVMLGN